MSIRNIFDVSGRAMSAQMIRLNTTASNLANANTIAGSKEEAFRPLRPVFATEYASKIQDNGIATVNVEQIVSLDRDPNQLYAPDHAKADKEGYVYQPNINPEEEMVEMMEASRQYQNNLQVVNTLRTLMARTMQMGK
jgi:flagellar basal-body rod protein FlgC